MVSPLSGPYQAPRGRNGLIRLKDDRQREQNGALQTARSVNYFVNQFTLERRKTMSTAVRANCFDASALLKLYVQEEGSSPIREYWAREATKFTTSLCFYEALTLLKVSHFYRKTLDREGYKRATLELCAWFGAVSSSIPESNFLSPEIFFCAQR